jgi:hypothetical protein
MSRAAVARPWASAGSLAALVLAASCAGKSVVQSARESGGTPGNAAGGDESGVGAADTSGTRGHGGSDGTPASTLPLEAFAGALAAAVCSYDHTCGTKLDWEEWPGGCAALLGPLYENTIAAQIEAGISLGTIVYDAGNVADCVASIRALPCDAAWPNGFECPRGIDGTVPSGGACSNDLECAGDAYCANACPGSCVPRGRVGDVCGLGIQCTQGTYCLASPTAPSRCSPLESEGESCNGLCLGALACKLNAGGENVCVARQRVGPGEPCDPVFTICANDTVCAAPTAVDESACLPRAKPGASCCFSTPDMCPDGETCSLPGGTAAAGTCVRTAALGDACEPGDCGVGALCIAGRCQAPFENGEPCDNDAQCWSYRCLDGLCSIPGCGEGETFR